MPPVSVLLQLPSEAVVRARLVPSADAGCMWVEDGSAELEGWADFCDGCACTPADDRGR